MSSISSKAHRTPPCIRALTTFTGFVADQTLQTVDDTSIIHEKSCPVDLSEPSVSDCRIVEPYNELAESSDTNNLTTWLMRPDDISQSKQDKPSKPPPNFKFPTKNIGKRDRKCQIAWLERFEWLEYSSVIQDSCYCFVCFWFQGDMSSQLTSPKGWSSWKDSDRLPKHAESTKQERNEGIP